MSKLCIIFFIAIGCLPSYLKAECKLNQYGFNICTGEHVIWEKSKNNFSKVKVLKINYYTIMVKNERDIISVDINRLIGTKSCHSFERICKGHSISISPSCQNEFPETRYEIKEVYENDMIESQIGGLFEKENIFISSECIQLD